MGMKISKWLILANAILVLAVINYQIFYKEKQLKEGELVLLRLAPLDPRSLMQGDYMELRYEIVQNVNRDSIPTRGYLVVKLDSQRVAQMLRIQSHTRPLAEGEQLIRYYYHDWRLYIGAESYFFQEGQAQRFEEARYGGLKVDKSGGSLLIGLYNKEQQFINP